jgi:hypothetical protein
MDKARGRYPAEWATEVIRRQGRAIDISFKPAVYDIGGNRSTAAAH